ncbi:Brix-domain-containing protein [Lepidopterella palustris CBS 459.81]|uniref:Brix-domain-containing protein n=1 Tax=Lepidopterella palustris CBS 459.81 TaxID=1314670 RepID=A0A8E2E2Q2_9PEZI|nr:Brix-domain-containing protein [Lepidopterella palustris CBS 459.81]
MASSKTHLSSKAALPFKTANKAKRRDFHVKQKKARGSIKRDERFRRKREEEKNPRLREERLARNIPITIDQKRTWDDVGGDEGDALGLAVDTERVKRQKTEETFGSVNEETAMDGEVQEQDDDLDSMLDDDEDSDETSEAGDKSSSRKRKPQPPSAQRATSPTTSTGTNLDLSPEFLVSKFPTLFTPPPEPKILITTSLNSTLHHEATILTTLFPNSTYIRRTAHYNAHKYSIREISKFASNRGYTTLIVLMEDQKRPVGLDIVHLPVGPMFHFTISNWVEGKRLPGHGNPTTLFPELILNNFRTPLGLLTAHLFRTMFRPQPQIEAREVVTLHNQRDYIFLRRHRYVFRERRATEKSVVGADGKIVKGVEDLRAGLQELGPRFTLKLRRVDRGIQRASGQEWEWKSGMEKVRTRFQM